ARVPAATVPAGMGRRRDGEEEVGVVRAGNPRRWGTRHAAARRRAAPFVNTGSSIQYEAPANRRFNVRTLMNKDQVTGSLVGNKTLAQKGRIEKTLGKVQAGYGDLKDDLKKGSRA